MTDLVCRSAFDGEKCCRQDLWKYPSEVLTLTDCANPPAHVLIIVDLFHVDKHVLAGLGKRHSNTSTSDCHEALAHSTLSTIVSEPGNSRLQLYLHMAPTSTASCQHTLCYNPVSEHTIQATGTFLVSFYLFRLPNHISDTSPPEPCQRQWFYLPFHISRPTTQLEYSSASLSIVSDL